MARGKVDSLGISKLKCTGMGEFNSEDHYIYYCGQESFKRNGAAIIVNKRIWNAVLGCNLQNERMISAGFQGKLFSIMVIQIYSPTRNSEEAEVERFYEDPQDLLGNTQKRCPFHYRGLECKSKKSRNTWSNRQIWLWNMEWSRAKANKVFPRESTGHSKHREDSTHGHHQKANFAAKMEKLYTCSQTRPGADCGSDHELLIAKFRLKLKKVGKTTRPFRYDLNQIAYNYTVEVRSRFKRLDLIDRMPAKLCTEVHDIVQETGSKIIPKTKKCKKTKWLSEEALQITVIRR